MSDSPRTLPAPAATAVPAAPAGPARRLLGLLAAALVVALLGGLAVAAPAHATRRTVSDVRRDVLKQVGAEAPVASPGNATADVTRFTTSMTGKQLILRTQVRRLPKRYWAMLWRVRTDAGTEVAINLSRTTRYRFQLTQAGAPLDCPGLARKVDRRRSEVTVAVPLTCLGSPASARTGAGAAATSRDFSRIFTDDAQRRGGFSADRLKLGRSVKPG